MQFGADSNPELQNNPSIHEEVTTCDGSGSFGSDLIISSGSGNPVSNICQIQDRHTSIESGSPDGLLNNIRNITDETIHDTNRKDTQCQFDCHAIHDKTTANAQDGGSEAQFQAEGVNTCQNAGSGCIILAPDEKSVCLNNQFKDCCDSGDCQSKQVASGSCEDTLNNSDVNDEPWMKRSVITATSA